MKKFNALASIQTAKSAPDYVTDTTLMTAVMIIEWLGRASALVTANRGMMMTIFNPLLRRNQIYE